MKLAIAAAAAALSAAACSTTGTIPTLGADSGAPVESFDSAPAAEPDSAPAPSCVASVRDPGGGELQWSLVHNLMGKAPPTIGEDGTLYIYDTVDLGAPEDTPNLLAVSPGGDILWSADTGASPRGPASIAGDRLLLPSQARINGELVGRLFRYRLTGTPLAPLHLEGAPGGAVAIAGDRIYVPGTSLMAFQGADLMWTAPTQGSIGTHAVVDNTGAVYFGGRSGDTSLHAVEPDGSERWSVELGKALTEPIALDPQGNVYIAQARTHTQPGATGTYAQLSVYNAIGSLTWTLTPRDGQSDSLTSPLGPIVDEHGVAYFLADHPMHGRSSLIAASAGQELWRTTLDRTAEALPVLSGAGTLYVGDTCRTLYAIDRDTGEELWRYQAEIVQNDCAGGFTALALAADGTLYATLNGRVLGAPGDPTLVALSGDGSGPSCRAPWPAEQRGGAHTGALASD